MDLRQLRYFVTVVAERNFNRAAERLHIAQPPLSRTIRQLEEEIGAELIDRSSRPLKLTPIGHLVHEQALQMLTRMDDMHEMVRAAVGSEKRRFTMGYAASTMYARLPELIREFRIEAPEVDVVLVESVTLDQIAALKDGRIDVGFGRIRFEDPAIQRTVLRYEPMIVALPAASPLAREEGPIAIRDLAEQPLILYPRQPRPSYADQVLSLFRDHGIEPRVVQEVRELQIAIGLVAAEEGFAIVPESVRRARTHDVRYRELVEEATSPIIMSHRIGDSSPQLKTISRVIARQYSEWGYKVPDSLRD
jgi:LysR family transcriptional regulator, benzoate and cis,cis-muconate-responsive activator of ben and cat genes